MADAAVTKVVAEQVRLLRDRRGWSARELAEACARAGVPALNRSTLAKIESGVRKSVTADELAVLAKVLGVPADALLDPESRLDGGSFDEAGLGTLLRIVDDGEWPQAALLYRVVTGPAAPSLRPDAAVADLVTALWAFEAEPERLPPILTFVEHLSRGASPDLARRLREWNQATAANLGLSAASTWFEKVEEPQADLVGRGYVVMALRWEGPSKDLVRLSQWRQLGGSEWFPLRGPDFVGDLPAVRRHVAHALEHVEDDWAQYAPDITVEFVLPDELIDLPVDQWAVEPDSSWLGFIGHRYSVVVRSLERMYTRKWHRAWRRRWAASAEVTSESWMWADVGGTENLRRTIATLDVRQDKSVLVLPQSPTAGRHGRDALHVGVRTGVPVMLWNRNPALSEEFRAVVADLEQSERDVREAVRLLRTSAYAEANPEKHVGSHIVLLWDDPYRVLVSPNRLESSVGD